MTDLLSLSAVQYLEWLRVACETAPGKPRASRRDPWVMAVSESRSTTPRYSSCADLAHWWLTRLGYRRPFLNRSELPQGWRGQVNVGRICCTPFGSRHEAENIHTNHAPPGPGDTLTVNADDPGTTHVSICLALRGGVILVAEYGQPGGAVNEHPFTVHGKRWHIGDRTLHSCLRVDALGQPDADADFERWARMRSLQWPGREIENAAEKAAAAP